MIKLVPLTRANWERAIELEPAENQKEFIPAVLLSIAQSRFEQSDLYGVYLDAQMIGFAKVAYYSHVPWVTRFMIDHRFQGQGHGRAALEQLIEKVMSKPGIDEIRTTVALRNAAGEYLFHQLGFERTGELEGREIVLRLRR